MRRREDQADAILREGLRILPPKREAVNLTISHVRFVAWCENASHTWAGMFLRRMWLPVTASVCVALLVGVLFFNQPLTQALQVVHSALTGNPAGQEQVTSDFSRIPPATYDKVQQEFSRFYEKIHPSSVEVVDTTGDTLAQKDTSSESVVQNEFLAFRDRILHLLKGSAGQADPEQE